MLFASTAYSEPQRSALEGGEDFQERRHPGHTEEHGSHTQDSQCVCDERDRRLALIDVTVQCAEQPQDCFLTQSHDCTVAAYVLQVNVPERIREYPRSRP